MPALRGHHGLRRALPSSNRNPDGSYSFTYELAHERQINAVFPWFIGTSEVRRTVLDRIVSGELDFDPLITNRVDWTEADDTYRRLFTAERDHLNGIVIDWRGAE